MTNDDDTFVYDEATGEWVAASAASTATGGDDAVVVRDSVGNVLADGDQVTLIKDLTVKGAGQTLKRGTLVKNIRLTGKAGEVECNTKQVKGLVLKTEFLKKA